MIPWEGRASHFKEGDVVCYRNHSYRGNQHGVLLLGPRVDDQTYELVGYKYGSNGHWAEPLMGTTWNAEQQGQSAWPHEDPDSVWADYAAWKLTRA